MKRLLMGFLVALGLTTYSTPATGNPAELASDMAPGADEPVGRVDTAYGLTWCSGDVPAVVHCDFRTDVIRRSDMHHSQELPAVRAKSCPTTDVGRLALLGRTVGELPTAIIASLSRSNESPRESALAELSACRLAPARTVIN